MSLITLDLGLRPIKPKTLSNHFIRLVKPFAISSYSVGLVMQLTPYVPRSWTSQTLVVGLLLHPTTLASNLGPR